MATEDKTEQLRQTWRHRKIIFLVPLLAVIFYFVYFALTAADSVPAEQSVQDNQAVTEAKQAFVTDIPTDTIDTKDVEVISKEPRTWPDGCLGLSNPDEFCTQQIVEGYEIRLKYEGDSQTYSGTYRTDELGATVRQDQFSVDE